MVTSAFWPAVLTVWLRRVHRQGSGVKPRVGDLCVVHWSGYTSGYQVGLTFP